MVSKPTEKLVSEHRVSVGLTELEMAALKQIAWTSERTVAWLCRKAIRKYLEEAGVKLPVSSP